ncbi:MAG: DUF1800 domain-containing protein [Flavobacteriales bacterium]|jgi:uncharacterized protein (DUF1800 family)|nr:DUF1800 domain-containing protein [Flavobacteriales bacterium]
MISTQTISKKTDVLGHRLAAHLLRKTTYNVNSRKIKRFAKLTPEKAVKRLLRKRKYFREYPLDNDFIPWIDPTNTETSNASGYHKAKFTSLWWMDEMRRDRGIHGKLQLFIHQNFMASFRMVHLDSFYDYANMIKYYSTRSYKDLAYALTRNQTMLRYLDGYANRVGNPNENYAREFLELFTIGKGAQNPNDPTDYTHYTEYDIQQAAKVLTGYKMHLRVQDPVSGFYYGKLHLSHHDTSDKTFSAAFGNKTITGGSTEAEIEQEVKSFIKMVFDEDRTAINICEKLYRFFVKKDISADTHTNIILPMAQRLKSSNYKIQRALKLLLTSKHFYDEDDCLSTDENIGSQIKSPVDLAFQTINYFNVPIPDYSVYENAKQKQIEETGTFDDATLPDKKHYINFYAKDMYQTLFTLAGMPLHEPVTVAGYDGYFQAPNLDRNWLNANTIRSRYEFGRTLVTGRNKLRWNSFTQNKVKLDSVDSAIFALRKKGMMKNADYIVRNLIKDLFPEGVTISNDRLNYFLYGIFLAVDNYDSPEAASAIATAKISWKFSWKNYLQTGDKSEVSIALDRLILALYQSPEFQTL